MQKPKFAPGNPKTGQAGQGDTSQGTYKREKIGKTFKPRGEGQGQRPAATPDC